MSNFSRQALKLYLNNLEPRTSWSALISALKILVCNNEDRMFVVYNNGLNLISESLSLLHMMHHEATACHVTAELTDLLTIYKDLIQALKQNAGRSSPKRPSEADPAVDADPGGGGGGGRKRRLSSGSHGVAANVLSRWKDLDCLTNRLLTLINSFSPPELREICIESLRQMLMLWPNEMLNILVPLLHRYHSAHSGMANNAIFNLFCLGVRNIGLLGWQINVPSTGRTLSSLVPTS